MCIQLSELLSKCTAQESPDLSESKGITWGESQTDAFTDNTVVRKPFDCPPSASRSCPFTNSWEVSDPQTWTSLWTSLLRWTRRLLLTKCSCQGKSKCKWLPQKPDCYGVSTWFSCNTCFTEHLKKCQISFDLDELHTSYLSTPSTLPPNQGTNPPQEPSLGSQTNHLTLTFHKPRSRAAQVRAAAVAATDPHDLAPQHSWQKQITTKFCNPEV